MGTSSGGPSSLEISLHQHLPACMQRICQSVSCDAPDDQTKPGPNQTRAEPNQRCQGVDPSKSRHFPRSLGTSVPPSRSSRISTTSCTHLHQPWHAMSCHPAIQPFSHPCHPCHASLMDCSLWPPRDDYIVSLRGHASHPTPSRVRIRMRLCAYIQPKSTPFTNPTS